MADTGLHTDSFHIRGVGSLPDYVDRKPVPAVAAYEGWIASLDGQFGGWIRGRKGWSGFQIRRAVAMKRTGSNFSEIARALRKTPQGVTTLFAQLPDDLK